MNLEYKYTISEQNSFSGEDNASSMHQPFSTSAGSQLSLCEYSLGENKNISSFGKMSSDSSCISCSLDSSFSTQSVDVIAESEVNSSLVQYSEKSIHETSLVNASDVLRFFVDRATKASIEAVHSCAVDNSPVWKMLFEQGLSDAIAEELSYENMFFEKLCGGLGLPYSWAIIDGYLSTLSPVYLSKFLSESLKRKSHPAAKAFIGATSATPAGAHFIKILDVFHKHGMCFDSIGTRLYSELERAVCEGNKQFICGVIPKFNALPQELLFAIMTKSEVPEVVISILIENCAIPVDSFTDSKILAESKDAARDYVVGLMARTAQREPEQLSIALDDDMFFDSGRD